MSPPHNISEFLSSHTSAVRHFLWHLASIHLIFLSFFLPCSVFSANPIRFHHLSLEDGLSQSTVQCILQDKEGFIWIGTQNGLNKYDGIRFTVYQHDPYLERSIANNIILSLKEDTSGYLWIGTQGGGLARYDKRTDIFNRLSEFTSDDQASLMKNIWSLCYTPQKDLLWIGTDRGLYSWQPSQKSLVWYSDPAGPLAQLANSPLLSLHQDSMGYVWIGTGGQGLFRFHPATGNVINYIYSPSQPTSINNDVIWCMMEDHNGTLWIGTNNGISQFDALNGSFKRYPQFPFRQPETSFYSIWTILEDNNGIVWAGTSNGLLRINPDQSRTEIFRYEPYNIRSLSDNTVWALFQDFTSTIWAGTSKGLNLFAPDRIKFDLFGHNPDDPLSLPESPIYSVYEDHFGTVWVGTDGKGLYSHEKSGWRQWKNAPSNPQSLSGDRIWSVFEDSGNDLWIGTYGNGLNRYDRNKSTFSRFINDPWDSASLPNNRVIVITEDSQGIIWLGTRGGGLTRMDKSSGKFKSYQHHADDPLSLSSNTVVSIIEDSKGRFWVGTFEEGLNIFDRQQEVFYRFTDTTGLPVLVGNSDIWSILEDKSGLLWIGTSTGLYMITKVDERNHQLVVRHFTIRDGLPNNMILGLMEDDRKNIWITTFNGISQLRKNIFDPMDENSGGSSFIKPFFRNYDITDGLQGREFNQGAYFKGKSGKLYAGGIQGLNLIDPSHIKDFTVKPAIAFTGIRIFYNQVKVATNQIAETQSEKSVPDHAELFMIGNGYFLPQAITFLKELRLSYKQNVLTFEFAAMDFYNPKNNRYACRMEGFEDEWLYMNNMNTITYTNLDPGEYLLHVIGTNSDGIWNDEGANLKVIISPPFWKTAWFILLSGVVVLGILVLIVYFIVRRQQTRARQKAEQEKEIATLQLKSIKNQINPHFTFNAINTIGSLIYNEDPDTTYDYFTKFSKLIRSSLQNTDSIYVSLADELDFVKTYLDLEKVRFKEKFDYFIDVAPDIDLTIQVPKMIIQTYAENAVKHGLMHKSRGGILSIQISRLKENLIFMITDNGIGREKAAELSKFSTHRGLQIINQFYDLYNRLNKEKITHTIIDLHGPDHQAAGTQVNISIPLGSQIPD